MSWLLPSPLLSLVSSDPALLGQLDAQALPGFRIWSILVILGVLAVLARVVALALELGDPR